MLARTLMVQGTASSVGKSLLVTALCRILRRQGIDVAPFKSQNMALNSFVTPDGREIGRAQAVQAEAAGIEPEVDFNPILLKPEPGGRSQVVVLGLAIGTMSFSEYHERKPELCRIIADCLRRLREHHDVVVIEGAGSPAEINLRSYDIVNMYVAEIAGAPVLLAGDIDRGGVFAQFAGTMELLRPLERSYVRAFVINKFRGDRALLQPGLDFLRDRFAIPTLGVIPYIDRLRIADEDSAALDDRRVHPRSDGGGIEIAVIRVPAISNYDDFLPLEHDPSVRLHFAEYPDEIASAALVIIPGSKSTAHDLQWLRESGFADCIAARAARGEPLLGICGGFQMMGESIADPYSVESAARIVQGLALLPVTTRFERTKIVARTEAIPATPSFLAGANGIAISAYEIHMGRILRTDKTTAIFKIIRRNGREESDQDGALSANGMIAGTMLHGIFENDSIRAALIRSLSRRTGLPIMPGNGRIASREEEYDRLARAVSENIDYDMLRRIADL
ncbi:MAG: cobyric acid synthase [Candidatus Binataceae bacterium]